MEGSGGEVEWRGLVEGSGGEVKWRGLGEWSGGMGLVEGSSGGFWRRGQVESTPQLVQAAKRGTGERGTNKML